MERKLRRVSIISLAETTEQPIRSHAHAPGSMMGRVRGAVRGVLFPALSRPEPAPAVPLWVRLVVALATGALGYVMVSRGLAATPNLLAKDFTWAWRAARALQLGHDPYQVIQITGRFPFSAPFFYPLPTALISLPVASLHPVRAGALFFGASSALLGFAASRDGLSRLLVFGSAPYVMAAANVQWSPLIMAAALLPTAMGLAIAKPNLGLAAFIYRPSWRGVAGGTLLVAISLVVLPRWPLEWLATFGQLPQHAPPIARTGGFLLLLALYRWRTPEGRLLAALACVPQVFYFYDQLLLWLVPRSTKMMLALTASSWLAWAGWWRVRPATGNGLASAEPFVLLLVYAPALLIALFQSYASPREVAAPREPVGASPATIA